MPVDGESGSRCHSSFDVPFEPTAPARVNAIMQFSSNDANWVELHGMRVLLVDDDAMSRQRISAQLEAVGVKVLAAENGLPAPETPVGEGPELVLMTLRTPAVGEGEVTRPLPQALAPAGIPRVAVTAQAMPDESARCLAAGMDALLNGPVAPERLYAMLLGYRRAAQVAPSAPPVDETVGLRYAGNKPQLYLRLLRRFRETQQDMMSRMDDAHARHDPVECFRLAHTLKSTAATVGATRLSALAKAMEAATDGGQRAAPVESRAMLVAEFDAVMTWITERLEVSSAP